MFKKLSTLALLVATASVVSAAPSESSYSYTGPKRTTGARAYSASVVPGPTTWLPSHKRPFAFTPMPDTRYYGSAGGTTSFSMPSFSTPSFSTPSFSTPSFSTPSFSTPSFATPSFATPTFSTPTF